MDETKITGTESGQSGNTDTDTSNNKSGASGSGKSTIGKQIEKSSEITVVDQGSPAEVVVQLNAEGKSEQKVLPKPRKKIDPKAKGKANQKAKERTETEKVKDIQNLLEGVFMVGSLKFGSHWSLTPEESKQIAVPLSRILERYDLLGKASEVSDPVALIVAVATITVPRLMITKMTGDQKKTETLKKNGVIGDVKKRSDHEHGRSDGGSVNTTDSTYDGQSIKALHTEVQTGL